MIKTKLNNFKVSIRRQQRNLIFEEIRKEQQNITLVNGMVQKILASDVNKQNFENLKEYFSEINKCLTEFSKNSSKGSILNMAKIKNENMQIELDYLQKLARKFTNLTSQQFKNRVLGILFEVSRVQKTRINNPWFHIRQQLLSEVTFMLAILFKQPESLSLLFPLQSLLNSQQHDEIHLKNLFQTSFQLLQNQIKYLKLNFKDIQLHPSSKLITLTAILHSLNKTFEYFVVNNEDKMKKQITYKNHQMVLDQINALNLENILRDHNFQHWISSVINSQSCHFLTAIEQNQWIFDQEPILLSFLDLIQKYCYFKAFRRSQFNLTSFSCTVKNFYWLLLVQKHTKKNQSEQNIQNNSKDKRLLPILSSLALKTGLSFDQKEVAPLCFYIIKFLIRNAEYSHQKNNFFESQSQEPQRSPFSDFYFKFLIAEQEERWINFLEALLSLEDLVTMFDISLDMLNNSQQQKDFEFNQKTVIHLFQALSYSIQNISGYFQNEKYMFAQTLISLFEKWTKNSFEKIQNRKEKEHQFWSLQFFIAISHCLYELIENIQENQSQRKNEKMNEVIQILRKSIDFAVKNLRGQGEIQI